MNQQVRTSESSEPLSAELISKRQTFLKRAFTDLRSRGNIKTEDVSEAIAELGDLVAELRGQGMLSEAAEAASMRVELLERSDPEEGASKAAALNDLALIQQAQGDLPGARASMERAIAIESKHFAPDHPTFATRYTNLAGICYHEGDRAAACVNFTKALAILLKHFDESHPHVKSVRKSMKNVGCGA